MKNNLAASMTVGIFVPIVMLKFTEKSFEVFDWMADRLPPVWLAAICAVFFYSVREFSRHYKG